MDARANFANSTVATAPTPALSGTTLDVRAGEGTYFPVVPFNASVIVGGISHPSPLQAEVVRVTNVAGDTFTIVRAQESSSARAIQAGDRIVASVTGKAFTDLQTEILVRGYVFWEHQRPIAIPTSVWTPVPWNNSVVDTSGVTPGLQVHTTTVAAGSNGAVLPQATINVASTTGFPTSGYLVITISGRDVVVKYTGVTGSTFTGCSNTMTAPLTLATSQNVIGANVNFCPTSPYLWALTAQISWAQSDTGIRGIRFVDDASGLVVTRNYDPALDIASQAVLLTTQPGFVPTANFSRIEVFQDSGGILNVTQDGLESPLLMMFQAASQ